MAGDEEGELIESGTFRVDRKRALSKLKRYQCPDSVNRMSLWFRAGVASGASSAAMRLENRVTEYRFFGGRPLDRKFLQDPAGVLLRGESESSPSERFLAIAYLNAFVPGVSRVEIEGQADALVIRIRWTWLAWMLRRAHPADHHFDILKPLHRCPIPVTPLGAFLSSQWEDPYVITPWARRADRVVEQGRRRLYLFADSDQNRSVFFVAQHGMTIGPLYGVNASPRIGGWVDDPAIALDLSMKLLKNESTEELREWIRAEARRFHDTELRGRGVDRGDATG